MHGLHHEFPSIGTPLKFVKGIAVVGHTLELGISGYEFLIKNPSMETGHRFVGTGAKVICLSAGPECWPLLVGFVAADIFPIQLNPDPYFVYVMPKQLEATEQKLMQFMGMLTSCTEQTVCRLETESRLSPEAVRWYLQSGIAFGRFGEEFPDLYDENGYIYSPFDVVK
jgi:hypothetical protein